MAEFRKYTAPPVHEVILEVGFESGLETEAFGSRLEAAEFRSLSLPHRRIVRETQVTLTEGPGGMPQGGVTAMPLGMTYYDALPPTRLVHAVPNHFSFHAVRAPNWPSGVYCGWYQIADDFSEVAEVLRSVYRADKVRNVSLRYLNRLAIPARANLADWLQVGAYAPDLLHNLAVLSVQQTWQGIQGFPDMSVAIHLARIDVPEPKLAEEGQAGLLLDIHVSRSSEAGSLPYEDVTDWYSRAHAAESVVFEACVTDQLRATFEPSDAHLAT